MTIEPEEALSETRNDIRQFFQKVDKINGFNVTPLKIQIEIYFDEQKIGGYNRRKRHWYVSKVYASKLSAEHILSINKFDHKTESNGHQYWVYHGDDGLKPFRRCLAAMTAMDIE